MTKFVFAGNGSYENKGCEAIVRGTTTILDSVFGDENEFVNESLYFSDESWQKQKSAEYDSRIIHEKSTVALKFKDKLNYYTILQKILSASNIYGKFENLSEQKKSHLNVLDNLKNCDAALCIGGDNYSLDYGIPRYYTDTIDVIKSYNKPCIIWGASVGPFSKIPAYEKYISNQLKKADAIFVREDESVDYLAKIGLKENVYRVSDPAFLMNSKEPADYKNLQNINGAVGINLSPIMRRYWTNNNFEEWKNYAIALVTELSSKIDREIYLIPHVVHNGFNNDYTFLKSIKENLTENTDRIHLLSPDYSASEIKFLISKLDLLIASRTHATIAGFSGVVPTISLAYSMKAIGINKEVYGDLSYCVTKDNAKIDYITELAISALNDREVIKTKIDENLIKIKTRSANAGNIIKKIITDF